MGGPEAALLDLLLEGVQELLREGIRDVVAVVQDMIDRLDLLAAVAASVRVPRAVLAEIAPEPRAVAAAQGGSPYEVVEDLVADPRVSTWQLRRGETQVLTYAAANAGVGVVLDDRAARRCAKLLQLDMMGTIAIVARAKTTGHITHAKPVLDGLRSVGLFISDSLLRQVLEHLGEAS